MPRVEKLKTLNVDIKKMCGQGYDGTAAKSGKLNGVQACQGTCSISFVCPLFGSQSQFSSVPMKLQLLEIAWVP